MPTVSLAAFNPNVVCQGAGLQPLPVGTPTGGSYSGTGVSAGNFDPFVAGIGMHTILYNYIDNNGCANSDTTSIQVELCVGVDEISTKGSFIAYPNPFDHYVRIQLNQLTVDRIRLLSIQGKEISVPLVIQNDLIFMDMNTITPGLYILEILSGDSIKTQRLVKY